MLRSLLVGAAGSLLTGAACFPAPAPVGTQVTRNVEAIAVVASADGHSGERGDPAPAGDPQEPPLLDAWSLAAREDGDACRSNLSAAGFKFRALPDKPRADTSGCGIPHPVIVSRGPTGIAYDPPIMIDCTLARALVSVERILQEEATAHLQTRIVRVANLGGYACRPRNSRKGNSLSAHAFGSALDVSGFYPAKGAPAVVARDYAEPKRSSPAQDDRRRFLHAVFGRLRRDADLTYAVGPDFNASHRDHFHLDRGGWHFWFHR
ncbi:MAG TPA: extensin family protein [Labilithrix sp.]|nr:extensin family protein [Labilithrix sp.]